MALAALAYWLLDDAPRLTRHLDGTLTGVDTTLELVTRPCNAKDAKGLSLKPGVFCNFDTLVTRIGDLSVTTQRQVAQTGKLIDASTQLLTAAGGSLQNSSAALQVTLEQHVDPLLDAARPSLFALTGTLERSQPLEEQATADLAQFHALLASPDFDAAVRHFYATLANVDSMTSSGAAIGRDAYVRLHPILNPDPCRGRWCWVRNGYGRLEALFPALDAFWKIHTLTQPLDVRLTH